MKSIIHAWTWSSNYDVAKHSEPSLTLETRIKASFSLDLWSNHEWLEEWDEEASYRHLERLGEFGDYITGVDYGPRQAIDCSFTLSQAFLVGLPASAVAGAFEGSEDEKKAIQRLQNQVVMPDLHVHGDLFSRFLICCTWAPSCSDSRDYRGRVPQLGPTDDPLPCDC